MTRLHLILLPSVLALVLPGWAEARPANATKSAQARPLNLSLPRDVLQEPGNQQIDETVQRNLHAPTPGPKYPAPPPSLPYGAGYEHRHHEISGGTAGAGAGAASGTGAGRRGR